MLELKNIGNKIALGRKMASISQVRIARQLSITPQAVGKWERGESIPDIITFNRLARILEVDLNYFFENIQSSKTEMAPDILPAKQSIGSQPNTPSIKFKIVRTLEIKNIGTKISLARKKINISRAQIAKQLSITKKTVERWECGESIPEINTFAHLTEILGVDINYFLENFNFTATEEIVNSEVSQTDKLPLENQKNSHKRKLLHQNWVDADFSGLEDLHEKFNFSNMQRCIFKNSGLSELILKNNNIDNCDFSASNICNSNIKRANFTGNVFKNCSLKESVFSGGNIDRCDFSGANFNGTEFLRNYIYDCIFVNADFTGVMIKSGGFEKNTVANALWSHSSFINTQIADIVFSGILKECYFENCTFTKVIFLNITFINTSFKNNKSFKRTLFINCKADQKTYDSLKQGNADLTNISLFIPEKDE